MRKSKTLSQKAIMLAGVNAVNIAFRTILPFILVRVFSQEEFGQYMSLWLIATTAMVLTPLGMKNGLFYFLPRHDDIERKTYVANVIFFTFFTAGLYSSLVFVGLAVKQDAFGLSIQQNLVPPLFVFLWVVASLIDSLLSAEQKHGLQAKYLLGLGFFRTLIIVSAAIYTKSVEMVYLALLAFALVKCSLLFLHCYRVYGKSFFLVRVNNSLILPQIKYSVPFGIGSIFTQLRPRIEHWVILFFLSTASFAVFSVITTIESIFNMAKQSIAQVILPSMSSHETQGNVSEIIRLNKKMNLVVFSLVVPCAIYFEIYADEIIHIIFTNQYSDAIYLIRIYLVGIIVSSLDFQNVLMVFRQGRFVMRVSVFLIIFTSAGCSIAAILFGLKGVAILSVCITCLRQLFYIFKLKKVVKLTVKQLQNWTSYVFIIVSACISGILIYWMKYDEIYQEYFNYIIVEYIVSLMVFFGIYFFSIKIMVPESVNSLFSLKGKKKIR